MFLQHRVLQRMRNQSKMQTNQKCKQITLFPTAQIGDVIWHVILNGDVFYATMVGTSKCNTIVQWKADDELVGIVKLDYAFKVAILTNPMFVLSYDFKEKIEKTVYHQIIEEEMRKNSRSFSPNHKKNSILTTRRNSNKSIHQRIRRRHCKWLRGDIRVKKRLSGQWIQLQDQHQL